MGWDLNGSDREARIISHAVVSVYKYPFSVLGWILFIVLLQYGLVQRVVLSGSR